MLGQNDISAAHHHQDDEDAERELAKHDEGLFLLMRHDRFNDAYCVTQYATANYLPSGV